jgi:hypothetical protein
MTQQTAAWSSMLTLAKNGFKLPAAVCWHTLCHSSTLLHIVLFVGESCGSDRWH